MSFAKYFKHTATKSVVAFDQSYDSLTDLRFKGPAILVISSRLTKKGERQER